MTYNKGNGNRRYFPPKKSNVIPGSQYRPIAAPSDEQSRIFDAVMSGNGNILIEAYAGCGKTTTCVEAMQRVSRSNAHLSQGYLIFAKRNAEEAIGKCPNTVSVKTAHAFGLQALSASLGKIQVDKDKTMRIATALVGPDDEKAELRYALSKAIDLGKDYMATTSEEVDTMMDKHGIETYQLSSGEFADKVLKGMDTSAEQPNIVSFSDMVWLPLRLGMKIPTFDILYADECQDLNISRLELVIRALGKKGRLIAVGDKNQSIFAFSGADRFALEKLKERTGAETLPLHRTYRCGKAIVEEARAYVPDYEAAETNSEGEVRSVSEEYMMSDNGAGPGDFILSRTNAPTVRLAMAFLKQGRKCNIQGKDLGDNLLYMIKRSKANSVAGFQSWLSEWASAEIERLSAKKRSFEHIVDKQECLEAMCEGRRDLTEVKGHISDLFADKEDDTSRIILSTVHKAKGLERHRVFLLEKSFVVRPKTEEDIEQEKNIRYVAITRAKDSLFYVE